MNTPVTQNSIQKLGNAGGVLPFAPPDKNALYQSYMPFVKGGGLYIPTTKKFELNGEVFILIRFPGESERIPAVGKVIWVNRSGTALKPAGIGVQLSDISENVAVREKIEVILAGMSQDQPTFTM